MLEALFQECNNKWAQVKNSKKHAAPLSNNSKIGVLHGAAQMVCQDKFGQIAETESISAGLDYPGVSPLHCFLKTVGRASYVSQTDEDALNAYKLIRKFENKIKFIDIQKKLFKRI